MGVSNLEASCLCIFRPTRKRNATKNRGAGVNDKIPNARTMMGLLGLDSCDGLRSRPKPGASSPRDVIGGDRSMYRSINRSTTLKLPV